MKKKGSIVVAILLLAVGFAAISTTLIINGTTKVSENADDFSVIFTDATDQNMNQMNWSKTTIGFKTGDLKTLNQTSVLNYEITNTSANYDAEFTVNCQVKDNAEAKYTSIKNEIENNATTIKAKERLNGTLTITLNKTTTKTINEEYECKLEFNAVQRDSLGVEKSTYVAWAPTSFSNGYFSNGIPTPTTTDYTTLSEDTFVGIDENGNKGVCINDNGLFCIKWNDYNNSKNALRAYFGESNCSWGGTYECTSGDYSCLADSNGSVDCRTPDTMCIIGEDGAISC